jgi:hypothetical protein
MPLILPHRKLRPPPYSGNTHALRRLAGSSMPWLDGAAAQLGLGSLILAGQLMAHASLHSYEDVA